MFDISKQNIGFWQDSEDVQKLLALQIKAETEGRKVNDALDDIGNTVFLVLSWMNLPWNKKKDNLVWLLKQGANINDRNFRDQSALTGAIQREEEELVEFLLDCGAKVNAIDLLYLFYLDNCDTFLKSVELLPLVRSHVQFGENTFHQIMRGAVRNAAKYLTPCLILRNQANTLKILEICGSEFLSIVNNGTAAAVIMHRDVHIICAYFNHPSFNTNTYQEVFEMNDEHPLFTSISYQCVPAMSCILSTPLVKSRPTRKLNENFEWFVAKIHFKLFPSELVTPIGFLLSEMFPYTNCQALLDILCLLLDANYPFGNQNTVSPLSLFLILYASNFSNIDFLNSIFPVFVANTVEFEQQKFKITCIESPEFADIIQLFALPDALTISLLTGNLKGFANLLQFFAHPPAYLIPILKLVKIKNSSNHQLDLVLAQISKLLLSYGLPNGKKCYKITRFAQELLYGDTNQQAVVRETVCSLQNLVVHKVRQLCRFNVNAAYELPNVLAALVPPGLRSILLMQPSEQELYLFDDLGEAYRFATGIRYQPDTPYSAHFGTEEWI